MSTEQPALVPIGGGEPQERPDHLLTAQVLVLTGLAHLDRPFDYAVPQDLAPLVRPGVWVKVRFAGTEREGFVISVTEQATPQRRLHPLRRVVSPLPVLTREILALCTAVARRYAGTTTDVLRLAVPPRHAGAEGAALKRLPPAHRPDGAGNVTAGGGGLEWSQAGPTHWPAPPVDVGAEEWQDYPGGPAFLKRLRAGEHPRAVWSAVPRARAPDHWAHAISGAVAATGASGRSAVVVLPNAGDVDTLAGVLEQVGIDHEVLTAEQGRSARYRRFVLALTGQVQVIIGTRSAAFAPVPALGLVVCWDDGDDSLEERRAPYPHARTVLVERAEAAGAAALLGGYVRTPVAHRLVQRGWAASLHADRATVRSRVPRVHAPARVDLESEGPAGRARIPGVAWRLLKRGLQEGPVLVQVPRAGYVPAISCARCRAPARCQHCHGRLRLPGRGATPRCGWCGRIAADWACLQCGHDQLRAARIGSHRTAEELGRAFPGLPVVVSGRDGGVVPRVDARPCLVVSTPGAEPVAEDGYHAAALLDAAVSTERPELDAGIEALRRWMRAAALVRSADEEGRVILLGHPAPVPAQALVRWDPIGLAERELAEREELGFPPTVHMVAVSGHGSAVRQMLADARLPEQAVVLGPVDIEPGDAGEAEEPEVRALVRAPLPQALDVNAALVHAQAHRSARKRPGTVRVQVDPVSLA